MLFNILEHKYTYDKIKEALEPWSKDSKNEPALASIPSRLIKNNQTENTNMIVYRKYSILQKLSFPSHYYLTIDDRTWHPGYGDDMDIFQKEDHSIYDPNRSVIEIKEKCNYCVYWEMYKNFNSDKNFNLMVNNCQVIIGLFAETVCLFIMLFSIIMSAITGAMMFLLMAAFFLTVLFLFTKSTYCNESFQFSTCPHIISIRKH